MTPEQADALDLARELVAAGVPVFRAVPDPTAATGFRLPVGWQHSTAADSTAAIDAWRPGDALCLLCGVVVDGLDNDPRNGGEASAAALRGGGLWPRSYGTAATPSGGTHDLVARLHVAKGAPAAGIDVQAGADDGSGRGFLFIAPTVRVSKVSGAPMPYRWIVRPDVSDLAGDDTGAPLADLMIQLKRRSSTPTPPAKFAPEDPFDGPTDAATPEQAASVCRDAIKRFRGMTDADTGFNAALNSAAMTVGHHVPAFLSYADAEAWLYEAAEHNGSVEYQKPRAVLATIRSGLFAGMRTPRTNSRAPRTDDPEPPALETPEAAEDRFAPLDWVALWEHDFSQTKFMPGGLWEHGQQVALIGNGKVGKSVLILEWAYRCAAGQPFLGVAGSPTPDGRPVRILYLDRENSQRDIVTRLRGFGASPEQIVEIVYLSFPPFRPLDAADGAHEVMELVEKYSPDAVIIDTVSRFVAGKENDAETWLSLYRLLHSRLKATGVTGIRLDHFGKDAEKGGRGSSAKSQDIDHVWELTAEGDPEEVESDERISISTDLHLTRTHTRTGLGVGYVHISRRGAQDVNRTVWIEGESGHFQTLSSDQLPRAKKRPAMDAMPARWREIIQSEWVNITEAAKRLGNARNTVAEFCRDQVEHGQMETTPINGVACYRLVVEPFDLG